MAQFGYVRAEDVAGAVAMVSADPGASFLAGGTTHLDLLLKDAVIASSRLVDITRLPLRGIARAASKPSFLRRRMNSSRFKLLVSIILFVSEEYFPRKGAKAQSAAALLRFSLRLCAFAGENFLMKTD